MSCMWCQSNNVSILSLFLLLFRPGWLNELGSCRGPGWLNELGSCRGPDGSMSQVVVGAPDGSMSQVVGLPNNSYKPITNTAWVRARLCKLQKGCTRLATANDKVYQLLSHGRWFSPGIPASSTTKTGRHDIAEILMKVALSTKNQIKSNYYYSIEFGIVLTVLYSQLIILLI